MNHQNNQMYSQRPRYLDQMLFSPSQTIPHDFTFIIGNEKYPCHRVVVFTLSPILLEKAKQMKIGNVEFREFSDFPIDDPKHYFKYICDYFHGKEIQFSEENAPFIKYIADFLSLSNLSRFASMCIRPTTEENALQQLKIFTDSGVPNKDAANIIAQKWDMYANTLSMNKFSILAYDQIFSSNFFRLMTMEQLYEYIRDLVAKYGQEYSILFQYVRNIELDQNEVNQIIDLIELDTIDVRIIKSFKERLLLDTDKEY